MAGKHWPTGIRPSGRGLRIRIWRNRSPIHSETIPCDPFSPRDLAAAVKRRDWLNARVKLGLPLIAGGESATVTVEHAAQDYLNTLEAKRTTHLSYENILNRYWMPKIGGWPVLEVTTQEIKRVLASLSVSAKTKKNILGPLRGVLEHAGITPNPAAGVKLKKEQTPPVARYTPKQRAALLNGLSGQERVYFALLFGCGLRPGEALALQWSDYDGEELDISKQITKRQLENSTKTSMRRRVYVPMWAREILNAHTTRFQQGYIFLNSFDRPHLDTDAFNAAWKQAHKKARIPYRIPYTCRHSRAAELLSTGVLPAEAAKQLGHSVEMFLRVYSEVIEEFMSGKDKSRFEGDAVGKFVDKSKEGK